MAEDEWKFYLDQRNLPYEPYDFELQLMLKLFTEVMKETLLGKRHGKGTDFGREIIDSYEELRKQEQVDGVITLCQTVFDQWWQIAPNA
ncbi:CID domain-containing protein [Artemisia annua]|uniref:CID domain-containing protein n=1 Tax=Artemisia annua TaxID=35608 RepID=A0A2U1KMG0_ARTAN|nr:CID domain-containing protein [Artemisia annua]